MVTVKRLSLGLLLVLTLAGRVGRSQRRPESQPVFVTCMLPDHVRGILYMSGLFPGLSNKELEYETSFRTMLRENFPGVFGIVKCSMWPNELQAERETAAHVNRISGMYRRITQTGWMP